MSGTVQSNLLFARVVLAALPLLVPGSLARAQDDPDFPRSVPTKTGVVILYEPQFDSWSGDIVKGRAAVSFERKKKDPLFGTVWLTAQIGTDRDAAVATILSATVDQVRFHDVTPRLEARLRKVIAAEVPTWKITIPLGRLRAELATVEREKRAADAFGTDPPKILVVNELAVLILVDGEPVLKGVPGTDLKTVVNSPFALVFDPGSRTYYTSSGDFWYASSSLTGDWTTIPAPPTAVAHLAERVRRPSPEKSAKVDGAKVTGPVKVVVSTEPTELLSFDGEPSYVPVPGTDLLYAKNSERDVFQLTSTRETFVLLSGRWFKSRSLAGPWTWVAADNLPPDFARIPPGSEKANVRTFVAGTEEAQEALLDAEIPQTTAVKRSGVTLLVGYDGAPRFEAIPGTKLAHALNASTQVLGSGGKFYACDQGVWFVSDQPTGPWAVATARPDDVDAIPPSSPAYNTKFVTIYGSTPEVVTVGYTPGYVGCYPWGPTIVYGTGWSYTPWIGAHYFPRPYTYGLSVGYDPSTGWTHGVTYSTGFVTFSLGWASGDFWGPPPPFFPPPHYWGWWGWGGYHPCLLYTSPSPRD